MTTWTDIPDEVLEPGKPIRSVDILALRDNPIAIAGGAVGAPRIVTNAIQDANVTAAKLATNSVTAVKIADANVTAAKLASNSVTTVKIADANVTAAKLASNSVTTVKIANAAVTTAKLATNERMTTANVLNSAAGASVGVVGTYGFFRNQSAIAVGPGGTLAGGSLRFSNTDVAVGGAVAGTWRCMGNGVAGTATVWLRIS